MASTITANFGWVKPQVGGDPSTWGVELNNDLDGIDAVVAEVAEDVLGISAVIVAPNEIVLNTAAAPAVNQIYGQAAGVARWAMFLGDGEPETGGNAGSNLLIQAYSDAGGFLSNAFEIIRATGAAYFGGVLNVTATLNVGGAATFATTLNVGGAATFASTLSASGASSAAQFAVNGSSTVLTANTLQLNAAASILWSGGGLNFNGPSGEMAEMDAGGDLSM